jgi:hypothetical protein
MKNDLALYKIFNFKLYSIGIYYTFYHFYLLEIQTYHNNKIVIWKNMHVLET